jgi:hypothetical protein
MGGHARGQADTPSPRKRGEGWGEGQKNPPRRSRPPPSSPPTPTNWCARCTTACR